LFVSNAKNDDESKLKRVLRVPGQVWRQLKHTLRRAWIGISNRWRRWRGGQIEYVVLPIGGPLPQRAAPRRSFWERRLPLPAPPLSIQTINATFRRLIDADNVGGVLLIFTGFSAGLGTMQDLRSAILRLRAAGKEVVVYTPYLNLPHYFAATAADRIVVPPATEFDTRGLRSEVMHYKGALDRLGVRGEVIRVSPYKTAFNAVAEAEITPEEREQIDWLMDDRYDFLTEMMAEGRMLSQEQMQAWIDTAPFGAEKARDAGLIDAVAFDDELARLLGEWKAVSAENGAKPEPAKIMTYTKVRKKLLRKVRRETDEYIGVISVEGPIVMGSGGSSLPFVGGKTAAEASLTRLLRQVERESDMAALIVYVNSGGGDALASELIHRQLQRIQKRKPVLIYMGNIAASGGYMLAAAGQKIICQPTTITGSIGVILGRISVTGLYDQLGVSYTGISRGANAGLYTDPTPLKPEQRAILEDRIADNYTNFKQIVAEGRALSFEQLDPLCGGRVWTGRQAKQHGLVDEFGDFVDAIQQAREMAGLPLDEDHKVPVYNMYARGSRYTLPEPFENNEVQDVVALLLKSLTRLWGSELESLASGRPQYLMPFKIDMEGW
jgi:protease-4